MAGTPVKLSIENVGKAFIADHISDSHEIEIAFHVHPDLAKFYLDLLRSNGVYEYTTKGMQVFLTNIRLCRMYVERYGEFYSSTHAVLKDKTACSQLEMNCPMLLRICNVVAKKNLCTLEELFGLKPLPVKYVGWTPKPEKSIVVPQNVYVPGKDFSDEWDIDTYEHKPMKIEWLKVLIIIGEFLTGLFSLALIDLISEFSRIMATVLLFVLSILFIDCFRRLVAGLPGFFKWIFSWIRWIFFLGFYAFVKLFRGLFMRK